MLLWFKGGHFQEFKYEKILLYSRRLKDEGSSRKCRCWQEESHKQFYRQTAVLLSCQAEAQSLCSFLILQTFYL